MNRNFSPRLVGAFAFVLLALCLTGIASAQTTAWNTNVISWSAPTTCTSGQPIANCAVTGYRVERSASATGTYAAVGTSTTTSFTHTSAVAGFNCYRVVALSAAGESAPSDVTTAACKTNVQPSGPPTPPTGVTVTAPTAYNVRPNYTRWVFERGSRYPGVARVGAACDEDRCVAGGYCVVSSRRSVSPPPADGTYVLAKCAGG